MPQTERPLPGALAPDLTVELLDGSTWRLAEQRPAAFTAVVFYRGRFCNVCARYLPELQAAADRFAAFGVDLVLVSADDRQRAQSARDDWAIELPIGFGLDVETMRRWGLFLSAGDPGRPMPEVFCEPGLFLVRPDGTLFYAAQSSAPAGRPGVEDLLGWLGFMAGRDAPYPQRGGWAG